MLSTEHLVFSVLISRNAREGRPCSLKGWLYVPGRQGERNKCGNMAVSLTQVVMSTSLVSATQKEGTKTGPGRHSTKALPSLESSQESPGDPQLPLRGSKHTLQNYVIGHCGSPISRFPRPVFTISRLPCTVHGQGRSGGMWTALFLGSLLISNCSAHSPALLQRRGFYFL